MIVLFSKEEEEKTVEKKKKKGNLYAERRKKQGCSAQIKLKQFKTNWMVFRQNTRPGLVFFGSRAAKLTFLFRFAEMDNQ